MSRMHELINGVLDERDDIIVAGRVDTTITPPALFTDGVAERYDFFVAPSEPIYRGRKLNEFAQHLLPGLTPDDLPKKDVVVDIGEGSENGKTWRRLGSGLVIGVQRFTEKIGHITITGAVSVIGDPIEEYQIKRQAVYERSFVRVYPSLGLAADAIVNTIPMDLIASRHLRRAKNETRSLKKLLQVD